MGVKSSQQNAFYRTIWRWHFYAGLFVLPFILLLSVTGGIYLFKPQIDRWEERSFTHLPVEGAVSPNVQLAAALAAYPGAQFHSYRIPQAKSDAAMIHLALADGHSMADVFVSPKGVVLGALSPDDRFISIVRDLHGTLLAGKWGAYLVELVGSWAIVMILSGLWLWWPKGEGLAGVVWPRLSLGKRAFWRDVHAVTGFWVSGLALVLLVTALPWAGVWGDAFQSVRTEMGWTKERPDWKIGGGDHSEHDHDAMLRHQQAGVPLVTLAEIVAKAKANSALVYPVLIKPPGEQMVWTAQSDTQNRPLRVSIRYDATTGKETGRNGFSDKHAIDKAIGYGIAWHEGHLLGWFNQLIGLLTVVALIMMAVSGFILWRRRKPAEGLGAPLASAAPARLGGVFWITVVLAALLPLLAVSLLLLFLFDRFLLPHMPRLSNWLGVRRQSA